MVLAIEIEGFKLAAAGELYYEYNVDGDRCRMRSDDGDHTIAVEGENYELAACKVLALARVDPHARLAVFVW